jgi:hypothetical protein
MAVPSSTYGIRHHGIDTPKRADPVWAEPFRSERPVTPGVGAIDAQAAKVPVEHGAPAWDA